MRDWMWAVVDTVVVMAVVVPLTLTFSTEAEEYLVKHPTEEQTIALAQGDPDGRVWLDDIGQVYQGSSLIRVSYRARTFEDDRIIDFLDGVGVDYEPLGKNVAPRR